MNIGRTLRRTSAGPVRGHNHHEVLPDDRTHASCGIWRLARNLGSDDDRHEYVVVALLCLHFQYLLSLKREYGSCGLDKDKDVKQDRRGYCKAGAPGD